MRESRRLDSDDLTHVFDAPLGHARTATTNDLYAHLRESDSARIAVAVNVAVNPHSNNPFREGNARPEVP